MTYESNSKGEQNMNEWRHSFPDARWKKVLRKKGEDAVVHLINDTSIKLMKKKTLLDPRTFRYNGRQITSKNDKYCGIL